MTDLHTEPTLLTRLSERLSKLPPGERSETLWHCLGFLPAPENSEFSTIGLIRAELATYWEQTNQMPVPIGQLRELVVGGTSDEFALFTAIDDADSVAEIGRYMAVLITRLGCVCRDESDRQLRLLHIPYQEPLPAVAHKSEPLPAVAGSLNELIEAGHKYPTVYADPPWRYDNEASRGAAVRHYPTMSLQDIRSEPVEQLTERNAHLHLWTTNAFFHEALQIISAWGFEYKSCLVWVKPDLGLGNYWRVGHEFLLLGVKGNLRFRDRRQPSWILAPRTTHSRKPGIVRLLVEKVSPGPYLELFGREEIPNSNWTVYGNQVERRLL